MKKILFLTFVLFISTKVWALKLDGEFVINCPPGSEYRVQKGEKYDFEYCCQDGFEILGKDKKKINYEVCGCPKGTHHSEYDYCCLQDKMGYALTNKDFGGPVVERYAPNFCGCPENGKLVYYGLGGSHACCKDGGYIFDKNSGSYDKKEYPCRNKLVDFFVGTFKLLY